MVTSNKLLHLLEVKSSKSTKNVCIAIRTIFLGRGGGWRAIIHTCRIYYITFLRNLWFSEDYSMHLWIFSPPLNYYSSGATEACSHFFSNRFEYFFLAGVFHTVVLICRSDQSSFSIFSIGNLQQHHTISIRW